MKKKNTRNRLSALALLRMQEKTPHHFAKNLKQGLRVWFLTLPSSGGMASYKACIRLLSGFSKRSGIKSAGNGALMRAPVIAACFSGAPEQLLDFIDCSTKITHTDTRAIEGARVIALATALVCQNQFSEAPIDVFFESVLPKIKGEQLKERLSLAHTLLKKSAPLADYVKQLNLDKEGVSGYINNTVPVAIYIWLSYFNRYQEAVTQAVYLGGDTDTTAAVVGALAGATTRKEKIPEDWLSGIKDYPITINRIESVARQLSADSSPERVSGYPYFRALIRNLFFFCLIIIHAMVRLISAPWYLLTRNRHQ